MTEEEINKKAEKHCNEVLCNTHEKCNEVIKCRDWRSRRAGFFCGYEQALKDFEKENAELKADNDARKFAMAMSEKVEKQLREENAELDCQKNRNKFCYSCANATERCFKNEIGCPCDKYKSWKDENAELKAGRDINVFTKQLTKAKEIIKTFLGFAEAFGYSPSMDKFITEAEQFLNSEVKK